MLSTYIKKITVSTLLQHRFVFNAGFLCLHIEIIQNNQYEKYQKKLQLNKCETAPNFIFKTKLDMRLFVDLAEFLPVLA